MSYLFISCRCWIGCFNRWWWVFSFGLTFGVLDFWTSIFTCACNSLPKLFLCPPHSEKKTRPHTALSTLKGICGDSEHKENNYLRFHLLNFLRQKISKKSPCLHLRPRGCLGWWLPGVKRFCGLWKMWIQVKRAMMSLYLMCFLVFDNQEIWVEYDRILLCRNAFSCIFQVNLTMEPLEVGTWVWCLNDKHMCGPHMSRYVFDLGPQEISDRKDRPNHTFFWRVHFETSRRVHRFSTPTRLRLQWQCSRHPPCAKQLGPMNS